MQYNDRLMLLRRAPKTATRIVAGAALWMRFLGCGVDIARASE